MSKEWKKVELSPTWNKKNEDGTFAIEKGDSIEGELVGVESEVGPNDSHMYSIKTKEGIISVWGSTVLDTRLKNISIGEEVKIEYQGQVDSEKTKGRRYHNYEVYHREKSREKASEEIQFPTEE